MKKLGLLFALALSVAMVGCGKKEDTSDPALQPLDPKKGRETLPSAGGLGEQAPPPQKAASQKIGG